MYQSHQSLRDDFEVSCRRAGHAGRAGARDRRGGRRLRRAHDRRRLRRLRGDAGAQRSSVAPITETLAREYRRRQGRAVSDVRVAPRPRRAPDCLGRRCEPSIRKTHPHRRYNPLADQWVLVSPHRTKRPWQGQTEAPPREARPPYDPELLPLSRQSARAGRRSNPPTTARSSFDNDFSALLPDDPCERRSRAPPGCCCAPSACAGAAACSAFRRATI